MSTALLIIDIQNDFLPGGALAVKDGDCTVAYVNAILDKYQTIIATADWHPEKHVSFASTHPTHAIGDVISTKGGTQLLWPDHCVQHTFGAEFPRAIDHEKYTHVIKKGDNVLIDSYSGFFDNHRQRETPLRSLLLSLHIDTLHVCGLATDYCVKFTVLDALELGFATQVLKEGCRAVNINPGDGADALALMQEKGATII